MTKKTLNKDQSAKKRSRKGLRVTWKAQIATIWTYQVQQPMTDLSQYEAERHVWCLFKPHMEQTFMKNIIGAKKLIQSISAFEIKTLEDSEEE